MKIGNIIKELRIKEKWSQQQLANKLNTTQDTISLWELNKRKPSVDDIIKLSEIFNESTDFLLGRKEY